MNLTGASKQWSSRPADERYFTLAALNEACNREAEISRVASVQLADLRVEAHGDELMLRGKAGAPALFTNWAFGQLAGKVGAPGGYLRSLPPTLAAQNLNHGLKTTPSEDARMYVRVEGNGELRAKAITSLKYARILNRDVTSRLLPFEGEGWTVPKAYCLACGAYGCTKHQEGAAGLYASDRDVFAFLVNEKNRIADGSPEGLARGFFVWNSEVGDQAFGVSSFLYRYVCGNHIVWSASALTTIKIRHVGAAPEKAFSALAVDLARYADQSGSEEEARIVKSKRTVIAADGKDAVLDSVFAKLRGQVTRTTVEAAWTAVEQAPAALGYGAPDTVWGMVNGLTAVSKLEPHTADRVRVDRAAGKLMEIAF